VDGREEVRWRQALRKDRARVGVKEAPSSGKSFLTRHTVAAWVRRAAAQVQRQEAGVEAMAVPI
jgi:hypothetical protein